jgi:foldase protein PrsA
MAFELKELVSSLTDSVTKKNKETKKNKDSKESRLSKFNYKNPWVLGGGVLGVFVAFLIVMAIGIYGYKWEDKFTKSVASVVPYPAAVVNGSWVTYDKYLDQLLILKKYQNEFKKVDFKTEEGKKILGQVEKDAMDRLVEDKIIASQAKKMKVSVDPKEVNEQYDALIKSNGGPESFANILKQYYGLTPEQYKKQVYETRLFKQKVSEKFAADESLNQDSKNKAEEVLAKAKAGDDFAELAKQYSQDSTASNGGDLGYFSKGKMVPEFEAAAFALKAGEVSDLVKTVYGYHIIKVTDVKGDEIKASHILIKTKDFNLWLEEAKQSAKIKYYINIRK